MSAELLPDDFIPPEIEQLDIELLHSAPECDSQKQTNTQTRQLSLSQDPEEVPKPKYRKEDETFDDRRQRYVAIQATQPEVFPVVVESHQKSVLPPLKQNIYLCSTTSTIRELLVDIRRTAPEIPEWRNVFLVLGNERTTVPSLNQQVSSLLSEFTDPDGFLYLHLVADGDQFFTPLDAVDAVVKDAVGSLFGSFEQLGDFFM